jgi:hypothetical protein
MGGGASLVANHTSVIQLLGNHVERLQELEQYRNILLEHLQTDADIMKFGDKQDILVFLQSLDIANVEPS